MIAAAMSMAVFALDEPLDLSDCRSLAAMTLPALTPDDEPVVLFDSPAEMEALVQGLHRKSPLRLMVMPSIEVEPLSPPAASAQNLRSAPAAPSPITPQIIRDLLSFGRAQVENGAATPALTALEANTPGLVAAYRLGWLPPTITAALSREQRQALVGHRLGNAVIIPAFDQQGVAVDLVTLNPKGGINFSLFDEPRGLLAPEVLHISDELIVTDTFSWVARLYREGHRNVLLLRGAVDSTANATRIANAGVQRVVVRTYRAADPIADALRATGLSVQVDRRRVEDKGYPSRNQDAPTPVVTPPVPIAAAPAPALPSPAAAPATAAPDPNALVFVEEEGKDVAIFQAGAVRYSITMRVDGVTKRRVVIRAHGKSCAHDLDLAVPAARERTAGNAARQVGLQSAVIVAHLVALLAGVQAREEARLNTPSVAISTDERTTGAAFLSSPTLLDLVTADLSALGWVGEDRTKQLLYLVATSRLLLHPLWAVFKSTGGAAPWQALACIEALTPPEAFTKHHRVTDAALAQSDPALLRHRLLVIDQAETIRPEAAVTLRILKERGGVGIGGAEARGPVAVLAAAAGDVDHRCRDCFMTITADESPEQTARILEEQRRSLGVPAASKTDLAAICARHHAVQRLLERLPVSIPFVERIAFPANSIRHREEQRNFIGIIASSALLHQRQRTRDAHGAVVATVADFEIAIHLSGGLLGQESRGISAASSHLLSALVEHKLSTFTMADLGSIVPDWSRHVCRNALQDLADFGHIEAGQHAVNGRGRLREYRLLATAATRAQGIYLRPVDAVIHDEKTSNKMARNGPNGHAILNSCRTGT